MIAFADEGPRHDEAVVLLHGFTGSKESWRGIRERLRSDRRVVAIDLPGHGGTRLQGTEAFTMEGASALVLEVLSHLGVSAFSLVGYSMGGRLALHLALRSPGRIRKLVLESASAGLADPAARRERAAVDEALARRVEADGIEAFVAEWERLPLLDSLRELPPPVRDELRRRRLACDPAGLAASLRGMGTGSQSWLGDRLGELAMPVLVLAGSRDEKYAAIAARLASAIPGARLEIVPGAGHAPHLERGDDLGSRLVAFLDGRRFDPRDAASNGAR